MREDFDLYSETLSDELSPDWVEVWADDLLLDCFPDSSAVDSHLDSVLRVWRAEIFMDSDRELVSTDTALYTISAAKVSSCECLWRVFLSIVWYALLFSVFGFVVLLVLGG